MKATIERIESVMILLDKWGLTKDLTERERQSLEYELKGIAGTAIMESQNSIQNILPSLYIKVTK